MLCQFKDIFGKPREGVHSYRVLDIAVVDVLGTVLLAYLISEYYKVDIWCSFFLLLLSSVIIHKIFCVNTTLTQIVFSKNN